MIELVNTKTGADSTLVSVAQVVKHMIFDAINRGSSLPLPNFFSPFSNLILHQKGHLFSIKMKEIIKKLKIRVSGRVRVGVGRALLSQGGMHLII